MDRNLGSRVFPGILRDHGVEIQVHDEVYSQGTQDEEWIIEVANSGLVAVTRDKRIARTPAQLHAVYASGLRLIALAGGDIATDKLAINFVNAQPAVVRFVAAHQGPFIARLARPISEADLQSGGHGALKMFRSRDDLRELYS